MCTKTWSHLHSAQEHTQEIYGVGGHNKGSNDSQRPQSWRAGSMTLAEKLKNQADGMLDARELSLDII